MSSNATMSSNANSSSDMIMDFARMFLEKKIGALAEAKSNGGDEEQGSLASTSATSSECTSVSSSASWVMQWRRSEETNDGDDDNGDDEDAVVSLRAHSFTGPSNHHDHCHDDSNNKCNPLVMFCEETTSSFIKFATSNGERNAAAV